MTDEQRKKLDALLAGERVGCSEADLDAWIAATSDRDPDPLRDMVSQRLSVKGYVAWLRPVPKADA